MNKITSKLNWFAKTSDILRPFRALVLAYSYVFTGTKVVAPVGWKAI